MYKELKGKRLLVLGGSAWIEIIKAFADENDIVLVSAGNNPHSPLASLGEYHMIDSINHDQMVQFIKQYNIDGVYIGSNEIVIRHAIQYLETIGMPHYCTLKQWDLLMNKGSFKSLCQKYEIPVAKRFYWTPKNTSHVEYPVIVKPADGCASVGITICNNEKELKNAYQVALENSLSGEVLVEKLVNNTGMDVFYQITNGDIEFCVLGDKYPVQFEKGAGSVAGARVLPSNYTVDFKQRFDNKLRRLFTDLGLQQGLIWMEVFHDGDEYYFNEVGYRPNGSLSIVGIDYLCGINTVAADIYFALTGKGISHGFSSLILKDVPRNKKNICEYWIASKPGQIGEIDGLDELQSRSNVLAVFPKYSVGASIPHTNGFAQNFCVIHFAFDNEEEIRSTVEYIEKTVRLCDNRGKDMVIHKTGSFIERLIVDSVHKQMS